MTSRLPINSRDTEDHGKSLADAKEAISLFLRSLRTPIAGFLTASRHEGSRASLVNRDRDFLVVVFEVTDLVVHREKQRAFRLVVQCHNNIASGHKR